MSDSTQNQELREAFAAGMVAKDSGGEFDEANDWFDSWLEDEGTIAEFASREDKAFQDGWRMAYRNVGWGHTRFTQHEADVGYNLWLGLDAHGNEQ